MANLIPDEDRAIYVSAISDIHDTFARDVIAWKRSAERINSPDEENDEFYDKKKKTNVTYTYQTGVFPARIKYIDKQDKDFFLAMSSAQVQVTVEAQLVRLKLRSDACQFIQDSEKVTVDGIDFKVITTPKEHGVFSNDFCTFYLKS